MLMTDDYTQDPEFQEWIDSIAGMCVCCPHCSSVPCDGVMAGGLCDSECQCEDEDLAENEYDNDN